MQIRKCLKQQATMVGYFSFQRNQRPFWEFSPTILVMSFMCIRISHVGSCSGTQSPILRGNNLSKDQFSLPQGFELAACWKGCPYWIFYVSAKLWWTITLRWWGCGWMFATVCFESYKGMRFDHTAAYHWWKTRGHLLWLWSGPPQTAATFMPLWPGHMVLLNPLWGLKSDFSKAVLSKPLQTSYQLEDESNIREKLSDIEETLVEVMGM